MAAPTVYIPNLNGGKLLLDVLERLRAQTVRPSIVVVDNASSDGSSADVQRFFPDVELLQLSTNVGFGRALNAAVERYPSDVLLFLNNDALPEPTFVEALLDELAGGVEMVAGVLVQAENPQLIDSAGVVVDETLLAFDYLHGRPVELAETAPAPLGPTGGAALVRLDTFSAAGGFDDRMFAYLEDVDLALRARAGGARCGLAAAARAIHAHSATLGSGSAPKNALMGWSRGYMLRRYGVLREPRRAARAIAAEAVISAGQILLDRNASGAVGRIRGWRAARGLPRRTAAGEALDLTLGQALALRAQRRNHPLRRVW